MADYGKYIGVPFKPHGRDLKTGVDCFGLCRAALLDEFGRDLPEWIPDGDSAQSLMKKYEEQWSNLERIDDPVEGCVGLFCFESVPVHMALYIGNGRVLHVMINEYSVIERLTSNRLKGRLHGWYMFK